MKKLVVGILAHVDAGKTTLAESMLYTSGSIKKLGRVDNQDAFLDIYELERARGITIFSKQALFHMGDTDITLLDTPGHVDFSAEMERTLQVLDMAILVISGADGVQGHTQTLWRLLSRYHIPVFLFVNKMDQDGTDKSRLLEEIQKRLDEHCLDFSMPIDNPEIQENLAMCDEALLEKYLEHQVITTEEIRKLIATRKIFPCYFGSALKIFGVEEFMQGIDVYAPTPKYSLDFGAKVFKISRDEQGNRSTHLKVTGGNLAVKTQIGEEKVNQIRIYSGSKYDMVNEVAAGTVCAVTGLNTTHPGEGLGVEPISELPLLEPILTYQVELPPECDKNVMLVKLKQLEEEEPELHIVWEEKTNEIQVQLMGEVQIEILKSLIKERFGVLVEFGAGHIVYKETIADTVEGIGHFEPLRHYAEVHLLLEPGELGSGLSFYTDCSEDELDRNWQRLILTHLEEREHKGVLTGSVITDMRITLIAGRAHIKHTEGGDFRQATYRAIRQGLKQADSRLLEPFYEFRMELATEMVGRAMSDIDKMYGTFEAPTTEGELSIITGMAPVATMRDYQLEFTSYTRGHGRLTCSLKGYYPCHNADEVIESMNYDSESDLENPTGSVFCAHGAGFIVPWDEVRNYAHVDSGWQITPSEETLVEEMTPLSAPSRQSSLLADDKELAEIFARTYHSDRQDPLYNRRQHYRSKTDIASTNSGDPKYQNRKKEPVDEYLLVDGYNIIFAWDVLKELAKINLDSARSKLMDILCNYQAFKKCILLLVFDAYKVEGHATEITKYHNIYIVYTAQAETADRYIERTAHEVGRKYNVTVATSDAAEQAIVWGQGCRLFSARELKEEVDLVNQEIRKEYLEKQTISRNYLFEGLPQDLAEHIEQVRLGKKSL